MEGDVREEEGDVREEEGDVREEEGYVREEKGRDGRRGEGGVASEDRMEGVEGAKGDERQSTRLKKRVSKFPSKYL